MKKSFVSGFSFGLTSGIITTLGLIVGLASSTNSKLVVIGGILIIAIADSFSDAFGMHISEEARNKHQTKAVWEAMTSTFAAKFIFALTFVVPVLFLGLTEAVLVSVVWGAFVLSALSFAIAKSEKSVPWKVIGEHLLIAAIVITLTRIVGLWIAAIFV